MLLRLPRRDFRWDQQYMGIIHRYCFGLFCQNDGQQMAFGDQRPIRILGEPRGKLWPQRRSCPPGLNYAPRVKLSPGVKLFPGVKLSVCPFILLNSRECSPLAVNEGVNIPSRGQFSPLGARGEDKNVVDKWTCRHLRTRTILDWQKKTMPTPKNFPLKV
jgi:hypothetical protein